MADEPHHLDELIRQTIDPLQLMQRVGDQLVEMFDAADGALVGLQINEEQLRFVSGSGHLAPRVGTALSMEGSLCGHTIRAGRTYVTDDTETDPRVHKGATRAFGVGSAVCVPLGRGDRSIGMLAVCARRPHAFGSADLDLLSGLADFISTAIGAATDLMEITARLCARLPRETAAGEEAERRNIFVASVLDPRGTERVAACERIERVLAERRYDIVFQPIFDLHDGSVFALEALARFADEPLRGPDVWLAEAHEVGRGVELELALLRSAIERLERLPRRAVLTVNAGPEALAGADIAALLDGVDPARIVVELTEHAAVEDYPALAEALEGLRAAGVRLAIDDAGAGFASLMHILRLAPDFIKLDRQLISGLDADPTRRSLTASLMRFAEESGATIVAEGVETAPELVALDELGIRHAQGFYLGRPAPLSEIAAMGRRGSARVRRQTRGLPLANPRARRAAAARA
jgi:EAL domain-containing protein (putative c-di-GMP-specific phosphodiesterase class I)/putative methionine-R-sulfoxide reductase with GAF domain